jgi:hypothetical protein
MSFEPGYTSRYSFGWSNFEAADPALSDARYDSGPLTASGVDTAIPIVYSYGGGYVVESLQLSPQVQHVFLFASAPTLGSTYPDAIYPNDQTGSASANASYNVIDVSAPVTVPVQVLISYDAHVSGASGASQFNWNVASASLSASGVYTPFASIGGDYLSHPSGSVEATLTPGSTLLLQEDLLWNVGSIASTRFSYPTSTGPVSLMDASNTGILSVQELDAHGNPVPGNPDLTFLSGVNYADTTDSPPNSVPEPSTLLLLLSALPILWLLHRRAYLRNSGRCLTTDDSMECAAS